MLHLGAREWNPIWHDGSFSLDTLDTCSVWCIFSNIFSSSTFIIIIRWNYQFYYLLLFFHIFVCRFTLLFSHGNAVDLGQMTSFFVGLGQRINCNIFSYDYSGYGMSTGKPTEKNLYADIDAAWHALRTRYGISPENIILYGQSIGTVPTVDLASRWVECCKQQNNSILIFFRLWNEIKEKIICPFRYEVGAVILHSPLMSGMRVAFPATRRTWFFDAFPSIDKVPKVTSPVLVIHGTEDEVIDFSHGLTIYEKCPRAVEPLWVEVSIYCWLNHSLVSSEQRSTFNVRNSLNLI